MADDDQLTAMEKVVGNPEMLDHIYSFLDIKSLLKARSACRQWREVSDLSLKRRMRIVGISRTSWESCGGRRRHRYWIPAKSPHRFIGKEVALKMQKYEKQKNGLLEDGVVAPPLQDMNLIIEDPAGPCENKLNGVCTAPEKSRPAPSFLATVLKLDWLPAMTSLELDKCLALEDWNSVGLHILQGFPSVASLKLTLLSDPKKDTRSPLCYTELKMREKSGLTGGKFEALEKLTVRCEQITETKDVGFDIVKRAPNLKTFEVDYCFQGGLRLFACLKAENGGSLLVRLGKGRWVWKEYKPQPYKQPKLEHCECPESMEETWQDETVRFIDSALRGLHENILASVTSVTFHRCITAADWALVGVHILQKFPAVEEVSVDLDSLPTCRKQLWESLMERDADHSREPEFKSVKTVDISYTACKWEISGKGNHSKARGVCYDLLKLCPNLKVFNTEVRWGRRGYVDQYFSYEIKATSQDTPATWTLGIKIWIDRKDGRRYKAPVFDDVAAILKSLKPKEVVLKTGLDLAWAIDSSASAGVETLTVQDWFLVPGQTGRPLRGANVGPAFQNVKKLTWAGSYYETCFEIAELNIAAGFSKGLAFENVTTLDMVHWSTKLIDREWEHVMKEIYPNIHEIVPNLQVLVVGFISDEEQLMADQPYSLTNTLKLVESFDNTLKHLVLVSKYCMSNCRIIEAEEFGCFEGLSSVTVIVQKPQFLKWYTVVFANLCSQISSIRKLGVYSEHDENTQGQPMPVDLAILAECDVELPEHLTIETGSRSLLQGKAVFEEVEDSYIMWEDVKFCKMPEPQPQEDDEWLAGLDGGEIDSDSDDGEDFDFDEHDQAME